MRVHDGGDQRSRNDRHREEPALEEEWPVRVALEHEPGEHGNGGQRQPVGGEARQPQRPARPGWGPAVGARRRQPDERERRPDQQPRGMGIRAVVETRRIDVRRVEDRHPERRPDRQADRDRERATSTEDRQPEHEEERPEDVELLLHGQRPEMLEQRRPRRILEVRVLADDQEPVRDVGPGRQRIGAETGHVVGQDDDRERDHGHDQRADRREEPPGPAPPEVSDVESACPGVLAQQEARDQVAADHEEQVDAEESARQQVRIQVVGEHGDDRERTQSIEPGQVGQRPRRTGLRRRGGGRDRRRSGWGLLGRAAGGHLEAPRGGDVRTLVKTTASRRL